MIYGEKGPEALLANPFTEGGHELMRVENESLDRIESLPLSGMDKAMVLLVWNREKPAAIIDYVLTEKDLEGQNPKGDIEHVRSLSKMSEALRSIGLSVIHIATVDTVRASLADRLKPKLNVQFAVSRDEEVARIIQMEQRKRFQKGETVDDLKLGMALGYPATAVQAYQDYQLAQEAYGKELRNRAIRRKPYPKRSDYLKDESEIPERIRRAPYYVSRIGQFCLSKEHWEEELEMIERWSDAVSRLSPVIYRECSEKDESH